MRCFLFAAFAATAAGSTAPAFADAVTYKGTLGTLPIIVEINTPPGGGKPVGRYAYLSKGTDIPLRGGDAKGGALTLAEEAPCTAKTCKVEEDGSVAKPPLGADWTLAPDGAGLSGTWKDRATGKKLPVRLERRGARTIDTTDTPPLEALRPENALYAAGNPPVLHPETLPYDFLKLDWPRKAGAETKIGTVVLRTETDPRNGVEFPVVLTLGGKDTGPVNAYLLQQRVQAELPSFSCRSQAYAGFDWASYHMETEADDDSNVPSVTLDHVSPRLIGYTEGGSYFCGGAHPDNFINHLAVDAATGEPIVPESLLAGFDTIGRDGVAVDPKLYDNSDNSLSYGPNADLVAFVRSKRKKFDQAMEEDCGIEDLIASNLGVYFTQDDLVFTFRDLPHAIQACADDILKIPLEDAKPLLTEAGARYFTALDR